MKNLNAFRQRDSDLKAEIATAKKPKSAIGETAVAEKRLMTDDERAKFLALTPTIEQAEKALAENAELLAAAEAANEADRVFEAGRIKPDADAAAAKLAAERAGGRGEGGEKKN